MNELKQLGVVTLIGLRAIPKRLGASIVIVIGMASVDPGDRQAGGSDEGMAAVAATVPLTFEDRAKGLLIGAASVWAAFYVSLLVQIVWYAVTQPWVPTPKPF